MVSSLVSSRKENGYEELTDTIIGIVPDITHQYTEFLVDDEYKNTKVRAQHAFQVDMTARACKRIDKDTLTVVDIGDSSGAHIQYLHGGATGNRQKIKAISVNLDPLAVEKIKNKGLNAILCRAEELYNSPEFKNEEVDLFLSFETLEHLFDPISFMYRISTMAKCKYFVITVPYLAQSRMGLHQVRNNLTKNMMAENTHIFELSPEDWKLLFQFSGWRVVEEKIYRQYPKYGLLRFMQLIWKKYDFEGFYGVILEKDQTYSDKYKSW
jgi:2-polyprenyl-3-methyl-5-hydroxy-6-metoxy-1,4-benzoquinol methylase